MKIKKEKAKKFKMNTTSGGLSMKPGGVFSKGVGPADGSPKCIVITLSKGGMLSK